jgi:hypothetical protein
MDVDDLARALWNRFRREVSASFSLADDFGREYPWTVMVEGDRGAQAGRTLVEALERCLEGLEPEGTTGWGVDAR